jgi:hypothetical protein
MVAALGIAAITPPARAELPEVVVRAFAPAIPLGPIALVPEPAPLSPPIEDLIGELRATAASWRDALPAAFHDGARPRAAATAGYSGIGQTVPGLPDRPAVDPQGCRARPPP